MECSHGNCPRDREGRKPHCKAHAKQFREKGATTDLRVTGGWSDWRPNEQAYVYRYRRVAGKRETQLQHRHVMEEHIGRPLVKGETVHHRNGQRGDNRIENLELWSTYQPSGQRPEDKVAYAMEILGLYAPEKLNTLLV